MYSPEGTSYLMVNSKPTPQGRFFMVGCLRKRLLLIMMLEDD